MKRLGALLLLLSFNAHAETLVKHDHGRVYPATWGSYHGSTSQRDYVLDDLKDRGLIAHCFPACKHGSGKPRLPRAE
jgi:hypothetical protein